jgi:uncharacterized RDD family membrane protein YckC
VHRHPWRRLLAWLIDWLCVLVWAAVVAAVGIPLYLAGVTIDVDAITLNVIASLTIVVPVTLALAWLESSGWHATLGKRALGIRVVGMRAGHRSGDPAQPDATTTARVSFGSALARNAFKIALPWMIGHAAVIAITDTNDGSSLSVWVWVLTVAAYVLPIVYVVSLFVRRGATPYDLVAGTAVVRSV